MFICKFAASTSSSPAGMGVLAGAPVRTSHLARHVLALGMLLALPLAGQSPEAPRPGVSPMPSVTDGNSDGGVDARMEAKRIATLNLIRQKSMVSDADKLLQLARELNDDALAGGTKMSASERMHKAAEIEKLAKNVKDKMTYAIGAPSEMTSSPLALWQR